ncbi:MAG TPA: hypothetical protein VFB39_12315 [Solirubrobacteraceae bacterium]|nr:hypothetical protein [Solirubrobacteraceae bacterium]
MHEHERWAVAGLDNPHSKRRIRQAHPPGLDFHTTRCKQPTLGLLERERRVVA